MISAARFVIGNAMLHAVQAEKDEIQLHDFLEYRDRLNRRFPPSRHLPDITTSDILEEAYSLAPYLILHATDPCRRFRSLSVNSDDGMRDSLINKLTIYYRNMAPKWLQQEMDTLALEQQVQA
ncbi:MAG: hypothetical protein FWC73_01655 [Defluviitaleaceae bacterium]|nr:hypothetical protein [Defluviitaleaceae bacterium]